MTITLDQFRALADALANVEPDPNGDLLDPIKVALVEHGVCPPEFDDGDTLAAAA